MFQSNGLTNEASGPRAETDLQRSDGLVSVTITSAAGQQTLPADDAQHTGGDQWHLASAAGRNFKDPRLTAQRSGTRRSLQRRNLVLAASRGSIQRST